MTGDGFGKPLGILNSQAGIPICETSDATPPGMFTWQDLVMLRFQIPQNFADGGSYRDERAHARFADDDVGCERPADHDEHAGRRGAVPHRRRTGGDRDADAGCCAGVDADRLLEAGLHGGEPPRRDRAERPVLAGWCNLFKFDARIGGSVVCPNAARLLRIR